MTTHITPGVGQNTPVPADKESPRHQWHQGDKRTSDTREHTELITDKHGMPLLEPAWRGVQKAPQVTGQCAEVLALIRQLQPLLSFVMTADYAIPEAAARVHDLRSMGFNIHTRIARKVIFRGCTRRNAAFYSLGSPEWPYPGFLDGEKGNGNAE